MDVGGILDQMIYALSDGIYSIRSQGCHGFFRCLSTAGMSIAASRFHSRAAHSGIVGTWMVATVAGTRSLITPLILRSEVIGP